MTDIEIRAKGLPLPAPQAQSPGTRLHLVADMTPADLLALAGAEGYATVRIGAAALDAGMAQTALAIDPGRCPGLDIVLDDRCSAIDLTRGRATPLGPAVAAVGAWPGPVRWLIPLSPGLVYGLEGLFRLAAATGVRAVPVLPGMLSADPASDPQPGGNDRLFAWDFVTYGLIGSPGWDGPPEAAYLHALADALGEDGARTGGVRVARASGGAEDEQRIGAALYPLAMAVPADPGRAGPAPAPLGERLADLAEVARYGLPAHAVASLLPRSRAPDPIAIPRALLIGAYGGEHIGDLAILGGVLLRIAAERSTTSAILMTQRPRHTRHLIDMLEPAIPLEVRAYEAPEIRAALARSDGVVHAGGPLTDLPKQLVRHLHTVTAAKRAGLAFVMEGIGPGVFPRAPSRLTARRILRLADRVRIRTAEDASNSLLDGVSFEIGRDPAFDYLETRGPTLTRLAQGEAEAVRDLVSPPDDVFTVGLNIRPISSLYTPADAGPDKAKTTAGVQDRFEAEFAAGMVRFARTAGRPVRFVFFPMNAIQFGMADLRSAHRINALLPADLDVRIWEADASLDAVVALLRALDTVVTMRFHATIFALSQGLRPIGVDYRIGRRYKVAAVMADHGIDDDCTRIDLLTAGWLAEKLAARLAERVAP